SFYTDCFYTHKGCKSNHFSFSLAAFLQLLRNTVRAVIGHSLSHGARAVVNSLIPCDLCDHSQISHIVNNVVRK
ncbi:unnamed protein product, partial [Staurois parvus]